MRAVSEDKDGVPEVDGRITSPESYGGGTLPVAATRRKVLSLSPDDWQHDVRRMIRVAIDAILGDLAAAPDQVGITGVRIRVVGRVVAAREIHSDPMAGLEEIAGRKETER